MPTVIFKYISRENIVGGIQRIYYKIDKHTNRENNTIFNIYSISNGIHNIYIYWSRKNVLNNSPPGEEGRTPSNEVGF